MERPPDFGAFSAVDGGDAAALGRYLDVVRGDDAVARWKELSYELLEARPGAVMVDLGCGLGDDVRALAALLSPGGRAIGVDASAAMIEQARARSAPDAGGTEFVVADATALPLADASADGCRCERVLQHLDDPAAAVAEMARVVRPGGVVLAAEPDWGTVVVDGGDPGVEAAVAAAGMARVRAPAVGRSLRRLLADAGIDDVEVTARTLVITDRTRAEMLLGLGDALERAVAAGLPADRAARWRERVDELAEQGRLTAAITSFLAHGRVGGGGTR